MPRVSATRGARGTVLCGSGRVARHAGPVSAYLPPGWPAQVPPPAVRGWEQRAVAWLLDLCPHEYRGYPLLQRHPLLMVRLAARHVAAQQAGVATAVAQLRGDLAGFVPGPVVTEGIQVLETERTRLASTAHAVMLVERALRGQDFVPRL